MSKKDKKGVLEGATPIETNSETRAVNGNGKSKDVSHLAEYQWKPGESGNPSGRPKIELKETVRAFADEPDPKTAKTRLRQWLEMADRRARQGSPKHLEMLLAYGWGRPLQGIELDATVREKMSLEEANRILSAHLGPASLALLVEAPTPPKPVLAQLEAREWQRDEAMKEFALLGTSPTAEQESAEQEPAAEQEQPPAKKKIRVEL